MRTEVEKREWREEEESTLGQECERGQTEGLEHPKGEKKKRNKFTWHHFNSHTTALLMGPVIRCYSLCIPFVSNHAQPSMTAYIVCDCGCFFLHFLRFHWQEDVYLLLMQTILLSSLWCYHL